MVRKTVSNRQFNQLIQPEIKVSINRQINQPVGNMSNGPLTVATKQNPVRETKQKVKRKSP